jgi:rhamnogalacturonyl hydrolase YesR
MRPATISLIAVLMLTETVNAQQPAENPAIKERLRQAKAWPGVIVSNVGVTGKGTAMPCVYHQDDLDLHTKKTRILLVAGFQDEAGTLAVLDALQWFYTSDDAKPFRANFSLAAVPLVNPDGKTPPTFPPKGDAYNSQENTEAEYVWRWIGMHAPDLVVGVTLDQVESWWGPKPPDSPTTQLMQVLESTRLAVMVKESAAQSLAAALMTSAPANTGTIPAVVAIRQLNDPKPDALLKELFQAIREAQFQGPSPARKELQSRVDREPLEIARQLAQVYGQELSTVEYIPAMALVGRLWIDELTRDLKHHDDVEKIVGPYISGARPALPKSISGSHLSGHLIFAELHRTGNLPLVRERSLWLMRKAADTGFDETGKMKDAMPAHNEMSDAVFMGCPILVEAGASGGGEKYYRMAERHFEYMKKLVLRDDGIYRHSPLCETAWGRGNGFPALGLALCLSRLPKDHPLFQKFLKEFQSHMAALLKHQDADGTWHQVIDDDASYRELTATSMITFSMIRGVRNGWLEESKYRPAIEKAFYAIKTRFAADGSLVDVCTGTGKQKTLRDYYDRKAILGRDPRGGAMALLVTTEMARWQSKDGNPPKFGNPKGMTTTR